MVLVVVVVVVGGCVWATSQSEKSHGLEARGLVAHDKRFGGGVQAMASTAGLQITAGLDSREFRSRDDPRSTELDEHAGAALAMSLRLSIPGVLPTDHHIDRFIDGGAEIGGGLSMLLGTPGFTGGPESFAGAWVELGNIDIDDGYLVFTAGVRVMRLTDKLIDDTVYSFGIGWRGRRRVTPADIRWR